MVAHCPTYTTDPNMVPLNIASDRVYDFLLGFIAEMAQIFPDEFVHTVRPLPTPLPTHQLSETHITPLPIDMPGR
jgi:hypothetical protein